MCSRSWARSWRSGSPLRTPFCWSPLPRPRGATARPSTRRVCKARAGRLRAILMTAFAMIAGMIPLALGTGERGANRTAGPRGHRGLVLRHRGHAGRAARRLHARRSSASGHCLPLWILMIHRAHTMTVGRSVSLLARCTVDRRVCACADARRGGAGRFEVCRTAGQAAGRVSAVPCRPDLRQGLRIRAEDECRSRERREAGPSTRQPSKRRRSRHKSSRPNRKRRRSSCNEPRRRRSSRPLRAHTIA